MRPNDPHRLVVIHERSVGVIVPIRRCISLVEVGAGAPEQGSADRVCVVILASSEVTEGGVEASAVGSHPVHEAAEVPLWSEGRGGVSGGEGGVSGGEDGVRGGWCERMGW